MSCQDIACFALSVDQGVRCRHVNIPIALVWFWIIFFALFIKSNQILRRLEHVNLGNRPLFYHRNTFRYCRRDLRLT